MAIFYSLLQEMAIKNSWYTHENSMVIVHSYCPQLTRGCNNDLTTKKQAFHYEDMGFQAIQPA